MDLATILDNVDTKHIQEQKEKHERLQETLTDLADCLGTSVIIQLRDSIHTSFKNNIKCPCQATNYYEVKSQTYINIRGVNLKRIHTFNKEHMSKLIIRDILSEYENEIRISNVFVDGFEDMIYQVTPIDALLLTVGILTIPILIYFKFDYYRKMKKGIIPIGITITFFRKYKPSSPNPL
jgi:hypothetical protein